MARIDNAGTYSSSSSSSSSQGDERAEYQANQDFQRQVMERRANENAAASDADDSSDAAAEETPQ